jgi:glyoxylase-like metal-dependent hydrolase (beta-lactamase superfamily II)
MAVVIPFNRDHEVEYRVLETLSPMVRRITAENPSPFSFKGTGTFVIGKGEVAVIDPGPAIPEHVEALLAALEGETVTHILVTHTHLDHSPSATPLKAATGAPTLAFGPHGEGRFEAGVRVEEGSDRAFDPDIRLADGEVVVGSGWTLEAVYTPGHTSNHLCFALAEEKTLFTGDHVMGWSTSVISPPDGDMADYVRSLKALLARDDILYRPTHGPEIPDPKSYVRDFIAHRAEREAQILDCIAAGIATIEAMVPEIYGDLTAALVGAAGRSTFAAIVKMVEEERVVVEGELGLEARYRLAG